MVFRGLLVSDNQLHAEASRDRGRCQGDPDEPCEQERQERLRHIVLVVLQRVDEG